VAQVPAVERVAQLSTQVDVAGFQLHCCVAVQAVSVEEPEVQVLTQPLVPWMQAESTAQLPVERAAQFVPHFRLVVSHSQPLSAVQAASVECSWLHDLMQLVLLGDQRQTGLAEQVVPSVMSEQEV
jgi:hypothetical protein